MTIHAILTHTTLHMQTRAHMHTQEDNEKEVATALLLLLGPAKLPLVSNTKMRDESP